MLFGDLLEELAPKGVTGELMAIVARPNPGTNDNSTKMLTARQAVAARVLGVVGDAAIVPQLVDLMFDLAATIALRTDPTTGDEFMEPSPLTTAVSMLIGGALVRIGAPSIAALMPYLKDDVSDPKVKAVAARFSGYVSPGGIANPKAYVDIATTTLSNIGLPRIAEEVTSIVKDKATKDPARKGCLGLLVSLPPTPVVLDAIRVGYASLGADGLRVLVAASVSRTMAPEMTDWLLELATSKKTSAELSEAALESARWLTTKADLARVTKAHPKPLLAKKDLVWRTKVPTTTACDPTKFKDPKLKDLCPENPDGGGSLLWQDVTPSVGEVLAQVGKVLTCDKDAKCYLAEFKATAAVVSKLGLVAASRATTEAGIRMQKAASMLAAYGTEEDMVALVALIPEIGSPAARSFVQVILDKNLRSGSLLVAAAIRKLLRAERDKGAETAARDEAQFLHIAHKLDRRAKPGAS